MLFRSSGGYADIWNGKWEAEDGSKDVMAKFSSVLHAHTHSSDPFAQVAIKVIRCFCNNEPDTDDKIKKVG